MWRKSRCLGSVNDSPSTQAPDSFDDPWSIDADAPPVQAVGRGQAAAPAVAAKPKPRGLDAERPFTAELDLAELDERNRPGPAWTAKAQSISPSTLSVLSRRMSFVNRTIIAAVHLIDSNPVVMVGRVKTCEYIGNGLHQLDMELIPVPSAHPVREWIAARRK